MNLSRRSVLQIGAMSIFGGMLNRVMAQETESNKSVIFVWLGGGIAQTEFTIPCPKGPIEYQSFTGHLETKVPGMLFGGTFTNLAKVADKLNIIHSFGHGDGNHNSATHQVLTSHPSFNVAEGAPQKEPFYGAMVSYLKGANNIKNGLPTFVKVNKISYDNSVWLGAEHIGYDSSKGLDDLKLRIERSKFIDRTKIIDELEKNNKVVGQKMAKDWSDLRHQAVNVIVGEASKAFEIEKEPDDVKARYGIGKSAFGKNLLMSRRLIERGSRFVSVTIGGWDMHTDLVRGFGGVGVELDTYLSVLINDLHERGMNKDCLVIVASEFGRTPKKNNTVGVDGSGRDHWPALNSLVFSGGNYDSGRIIGKADDKSANPISKPLTPYDLCATIFDHCQLKKDAQKIDAGGRPRYLLEHGECIL